MIKFFEELMAGLLGAKDQIAIPVRVDAPRPQDKQLKRAK